MSSVSFEKLLHLAQQRAVDGKGGLAASITKMCLQSDLKLSADERRLTYEILFELVADVETEIRRYIADYLSSRNDVPMDLLDFLANDTIHVAYPILVNSEQLNDGFLIELIQRKQKGHHVAICERKSLSESISQALVETNELEVMEKLAENPGASFCDATYDRLANASKGSAALQHHLLNRSDIPSRLINRLYIWAGEATRQFILRNYTISDDLINAAHLYALEQTTNENKVSSSEEKNIILKDEAKTDQLVSVLTHGGRGAFITEFSEYTDIPENIAEKIFDITQINAIAAACKAIGFKARQFELLLEKFSEDKFYNFASSNLIIKAIEYYERLETTKAEKQLQKWRISASND